jgi:protoheme IX farnesyltransferase
MGRTAQRPIPAGRIEPDEALAFGLIAGDRLGPVPRYLLSNWLAAALLAFTIFFYVVVYPMWAEALDGAEHRHRRGRRRFSADDRLCGGDRRTSAPRVPCSS